MSHVCSAAQDSYAGAATLRVYGELPRFRAQFEHHMNRVVECRLVEVVSGNFEQQDNKHENLDRQQLDSNPNGHGDGFHALGVHDCYVLGFQGGVADARRLCASRQGVYSIGRHVWRAW